MFNSYFSLQYHCPREMLENGQSAMRQHCCNFGQGEYLYSVFLMRLLINYLNKQIIRDYTHLWLLARLVPLVEYYVLK